MRSSKHSKALQQKSGELTSPSKPMPMEPIGLIKTSPRKKNLNGEQEAQVIALRLSDPPDGHKSWTLRLLADKVVE